MKKRIVSVVLAALMVLSMIPAFAVAASAEENSWFVVVNFSNLTDAEGRSYATANGQTLTEPYYVVPEVEDARLEGYVLKDFYCSATDKAYKVGDRIPLEDFPIVNGQMNIVLQPRFTKVKNPGVEYVDKDRYDISVRIAQPTDPDMKANLKAAFTASFDKLAGQTLEGMADYLYEPKNKQLRLYNSESPAIGYRSVVTGNVFLFHEDVTVSMLPEAEYVGEELVELDEEKGVCTSVYQIEDVLVPLFNWNGFVGAYFDPMFKAEIQYWYTEVVEEEGQEPMTFYGLLDQQYLDLSISNYYEYPLILSGCPDYMEDLGYVFDGYGAWDDDEITYPEGEIWLDMFDECDQDGNMIFRIVMHFSPVDEEATPEEQLAAAKEKLGARYRTLAADEASSDGLKAVAEAALAAVDTAADMDALRAVCAEAANDIKLQNAKDEACAGLAELIPEDADNPGLQAVIDKAAAAIQDCTDTAGFADIIDDAREAIAAIIEGGLAEVEYTVLKDAIAAYEALDMTRYTKESAAAAEAAYLTAAAALESDDQGEVDAAAYALNTAVEELELAPADPFGWIYGRKLATGSAALRKAPSYSEDALYASTGVIPYVVGETDVINLGKFDNYTSARIVWLDANGSVIAYSSSFKAGVDVDVNYPACNGTKKGAVAYMLVVTLAQTAAKGPAAFETVSAKTRFVTAVEPEPVVEPVIADDGFGWVYGRKLATGSTSLRKAPSYSEDAQYASTGIIPYIVGETDVVNLGKYDNYTSARVLWLDANGNVIAYSSSFKAGVDKNVNSLACNGTKKGAVAYMLTVQLAQTAAKGAAAYEVVTGSSVIIATGLPEAKKTVTYSVVYKTADGTTILGKKENVEVEKGAAVTENAPAFEGYKVVGNASVQTVVEDGQVIVFTYEAVKLTGMYIVRYKTIYGTTLDEKIVTGIEVGSVVTEYPIEIEGHTCLDPAPRTVTVDDPDLGGDTPEIVFIYM